MDRKEIKELAKKKIKGNLWEILWPALVIMGISIVLSSLFGNKAIDVNISKLGDLHDLSHVHVNTNPTSYLTGIITAIIYAGYIKYILTFIRKDKFNRDIIISTIKDKWIDILIATILVSLIVTICTFFLVIPGIIMGLAYSFAIYLVIDTNVKGNDSLKKSREMMDGYKLDYFVFTLSFIGWFILGGLTLGILFIWVFPYYVVSCSIYYDKLKEKTK